MYIVSLSPKQLTSIVFVFENSLSTFIVDLLTIDSEIEPETEVEFGTSKNGAYSLQGLNIAERTELYAKNIVNGNEVEY